MIAVLWYNRKKILWNKLENFDMTNLDAIKLFQWISNQTKRGNKSSCAVNRAADILEVDVNDIYKVIGGNEVFRYKTRQKALPGWMKAV